MASVGLLAIPFLLLLQLAPLLALELGSCGSALGMESGSIRDAQITASSAYDSASVGPQRGRLRNDKNGGAWCPRQMVSRDAKEFIEIGLEAMHVFTGLKTQGRYGNGQGQEYAEEYMLEYFRPGMAKWRRWKDRSGKELLTGNTNTFTIVEQKLDPVIIATKIRILPYSDHVRTVCMRIELIGCKWTDGLLSYEVPQGVRRGDFDLTDRSYDGAEEDGLLQHGLGQLVDGRKGHDNFRMDLAGRGTGYEWVGWRNDTPGWAGHPLEIRFHFDRVRNFSAAHLHTNNLFTKDVQVFSHARAFFSLTADVFSGEPVHFSYMPDVVLEHARNVTIKLHQRIGRFLKLQLYFASRWILLSEISFDSVAVTGNVSGTIEDSPVPPEVVDGDTLQRDEVKMAKVNRNGTTLATLEKATKSGKDDDDEPKHYIGFVIGILSVVILILVAAIVFIVYRNRRIKASAAATQIPRKIEEDKMTMEDCDKSALYVETSKTSLYARQTYPTSPDYTEVPDLVHHQLETKPPTLVNFLPKPPPVPPPPASYYTERDLSPSPCFMADNGIADAAANDDDDIIIPVFPCDQLRIIEKLADGPHVDLHLCERTVLLNNDEVRFVSVQTLRMEAKRGDFEREVKALARLGDDANVARLVGACLDAAPICAVREYAVCGDLCQFLQDHVAETATPLAPTAKALSYGSLIYMATQIASGMKYLESLRYVHKDLASRNCLVGERYHIKISDLGCYRKLYSHDYCLVGDELRPLRWMAWESVLLGKYSSKSDVWSFAVLLWEIMTFAREQPFEEFNDDGVIENVTHFYQNDGKQLLPSAPINCPKEIFDLMHECWQRNESDRPNFREIHLFLQRKNLGYHPALH